MKWLLCSLICLAGCTLDQARPTPEPAPPNVVFLPSPPEPATQCLQLASTASEMPAYVHPTATKRRKASQPLPLESQPVNLPPMPRTKPVSPERLIRDAEQDSLVYPSQRGYHGSSARQRYVWQPGKLFVVYLSVYMATDIELPPGERLASALTLDPEAYEVSTVRVGSELATKDVIKIRALMENTSEGKTPARPVNVSLLAESGRSYDLHLIPGKISMFGVRFELAPIMHLQTDEEPILPRPVR